MWFIIRTSYPDHRISTNKRRSFNEKELPTWNSKELISWRVPKSFPDSHDIEVMSFINVFPFALFSGAACWKTCPLLGGLKVWAIPGYTVTWSKKNPQCECSQGLFCLRRALGHSYVDSFTPLLQWVVDGARIKHAAVIYLNLYTQWMNNGSKQLFELRRISVSI